MGRAQTAGLSQPKNSKLASVQTKETHNLVKVSSPIADKVGKVVNPQIRPVKPPGYAYNI